MSTPRIEQQNPYKGNPFRSWVRIRFVGPDARSVELELVADTGCPCAIILGAGPMAQLQRGSLESRISNFGELQGGWLRLNMPELGLDHFVPGYASDDVVVSTQASSSDFQGLAGLPMLRLLEFGGNAAAFWVRRA